MKLGSYVLGTKTKSGTYFFIDFLEGAKGSGASRPDQKVGQLDGLFGSSVISKTCFQKFRAGTPQDDKITIILYFIIIVMLYGQKTKVFNLQILNLGLRSENIEFFKSKKHVFIFFKFDILSYNTN